jgi:NADH:ubiquinone oxidoreductase subunit E
MPYRLPDGERGKVFEEQVGTLSKDPACLLEVLHLAQETFGCLTKPVLGWVAQELRIPKSQVYAIATFYSLFALKPQSRYVIRVCDSLSCYLRGDGEVLKAIRDAAHIPDGEVASQDGLFSLSMVSCLGLCDQSPAMMVNQESYGFLTAEKVYHIVSELRRRQRMEGRQP